MIAAEFLIFWHSKGHNRGLQAPAAAILALPQSSPYDVVHRRNLLKEGESASYSFFLAKDTTVHIEITATPKPVDVMVMTGDDAAKFQEGEGRFLAFLAPAYTYWQALSAQDVTTLDRTDILGPGNWVLVIKRPREAVFFKENTVASTIITIY